MLFYPVLVMQDEFRRRTLSAGKWMKITHAYNAAIPAARVNQSFQEYLAVLNRGRHSSSICE